MTQEQDINRENYLSLLEDIWDLDDKSMDYIKHRLSDEWKPVEEFQKLIDSNVGTYEDQRIRIDMDLANTDVQEIFKETDQAYSLFKTIFNHALDYLSDKYNCEITYQNFIENKVVFRKNTTKIKKVLETAYAENNEVFERDACRNYSKEKCAAWIVEQNEKIGASKKSAKKLQLVISFNPIDWMMSSTAETWSSCFNINNTSGGFQYCLGLPFLCGDKNRFLAYITDGSKKECMGMTVDHFQTRTWCILDKSGNFAVTKWYPNDTVGIKPLMSLVSPNFCDRTKFTGGKYPLDIISTKKGAVIGVFLDMGTWEVVNDELRHEGNEKGMQQIFTKDLVPITGSRFEHTYKFSKPFQYITGYDLKTWRNAGAHVDAMFTSLKCSSCKDEKPCFYVNQRPMCSHCFKTKTFYCEQCHQTHIITDTVKPVKVIDTLGEEKTVCQECYKNIKICKHCGKAILNTDYEVIDGDYYCQSCFDQGYSGYTKCSCGALKKSTKYMYNRFTRKAAVVCEDCIDNADAFDGSYTYNRMFNITTTERDLRGLITVE